MEQGSAQGLRSEEDGKRGELQGQTKGISLISPYFEKGDIRKKGKWQMLGKMN